MRCGEPARVLSATPMRARAILVAWVLSAQVIAPSLALASTVRATCCCATREKQCHCPGCTRARALESGHGLLTQCGGSQGQALTPSVHVVVQPADPVQPKLAAGSVADFTSLSPPFSTRDVPTPPPLG